MKIIENIEDFPELSFPVVTSGTFDGVHLGHRKILQRLIENAKHLQGQSVVITYWPHPRLVINPNDDFLKLLSTITERKLLLAGLGVEYLLIVPFTKEFSELSSEEYVQKILIEAVGTKKLVIGYDHHFGKNREGNFEYLNHNAASFGFGVEEIPRQDIDEVGISSTKIRKALELGKVETAASYLGRPYSVTGKVVEGKKLGRTIGYPTANIAVPEPYKLIPAIGIYAVNCQVNDQTYGGMLSIGTNPTVGGTSVTVEVYIFDFNKDIYGQELTLNFISWLREEEKYDSLEELKAQLQKDEVNAKAALANFAPDTNQ